MLEKAISRVSCSLGTDEYSRYPFSHHARAAGDYVKNSISSRMLSHRFVHGGVRFSSLGSFGVVTVAFSLLARPYSA